MSEGLVLDLLLGVLLLGYLVYGLRSGLARSAGGIIGVIVGVIAAFFVAPVVAQWLPWPEWRLAASIALVIACIAIGHAIGAGIGHAVRRRVDRTPLRAADRLLGGLATGAAAALIASVLAASVSALGVPALSRAVAQSTVLRTIDGLTPDPVQAFLAEVRASIFDGGLPRITGVLGGTPTAVPDAATDTEPLAVAARSVVRITGTAYACGQIQSGTGFVVSDDRVVTNAHVVAGVDEPVVETPGGEVLGGRVVYFDPADDLAVIAVDDMTADPLALSTTQATGADAVVQGYPYGGPFTTSPAEVAAVGVTAVPDIYGESASPREVYTLAAVVREGNSGGPLLSEQGTVIGVIFARSADDGDVGYAMTMAELNPVAAQASALDDAIASGSCTRG